MLKENQKAINGICREREKAVSKELSSIDKIKWKQIDNCQAWYTETENYYILKSYETVIACISKNNSYCYNFMHYVFDFSCLEFGNRYSKRPGATSSNHVRRLCKIYETKTGKILRGLMTYRDV